MLSDTVHRIVAIVLALGLVFGPVTGSVQAASMNAKMVVAASSGMHSSRDCNDCGTTKTSMSGAACTAAYCSGITALPYAGSAVFDWLPADTFAPTDARHVSGHVGPPDPYPPKPTILS